MKQNTVRKYYDNAQSVLNRFHSLKIESDPELCVCVCSFFRAVYFDTLCRFSGFCPPPLCLSIFPVPLCESNIDCSTYNSEKNAVHFWLQFVQSVELLTVEFARITQRTQT